MVVLDDAEIDRALLLAAGNSARNVYATRPKSKSGLAPAPRRSKRAARDKGSPRNDEKTSPPHASIVKKKAGARKNRHKLHKLLDAWSSSSSSSSVDAGSKKSREQKERAGKDGHRTLALEAERKSGKGAGGWHHHPDPSHHKQQVTIAGYSGPAHQEDDAHKTAQQGTEAPHKAIGMNPFGYREDESLPPSLIQLLAAKAAPPVVPKRKSNVHRQGVQHMQGAMHGHAPQVPSRSSKFLGHSASNERLAYGARADIQSDFVAMAAPRSRSAPSSSAADDARASAVRAGPHSGGQHLDAPAVASLAATFGIQTPPIQTPPRRDSHQRPNAHAHGAAQHSHASKGRIGAAPKCRRPSDDSVHQIVLEQDKLESMIEYVRHQRETLNVMRKSSPKNGDDLQRSDESSRTCVSGEWKPSDDGTKRQRLSDESNCTLDSARILETHREAFTEAAEMPAPRAMLPAESLQPYGCPSDSPQKASGWVAAESEPTQSVPRTKSVPKAPMEGEDSPPHVHRTISDPSHNSVQQAVSDQLQPIMRASSVKGPSQRSELVHSISNVRAPKSHAAEWAESDEAPHIARATSLDSALKPSPWYVEAAQLNQSPQSFARTSSAPLEALHFNQPSHTVARATSAETSPVTKPRLSSALSDPQSPATSNASKAQSAILSPSKRVYGVLSPPLPTVAVHTHSSRANMAGREPSAFSPSASHAHATKAPLIAPSIGGFHIQHLQEGSEVSL